jgi:hypothetical protein
MQLLAVTKKAGPLLTYNAAPMAGEPAIDKSHSGVL